MKSFLSVKGILVMLLLLVVSFGSGTALAEPQAGVTPQDSLGARLDGATLMTSSVCAARDNGKIQKYDYLDALTDFRGRDEPFMIWGSGFGPGEFILLSVIKGANNAPIWHSGMVNDAGAFERIVVIDKDPDRRNSDMVRYPGAGVMTLEVIGSSGRLATTPVVFVDEKCPAGDPVALENYLSDRFTQAPGER